MDLKLVAATMGRVRVDRAHCLNWSVVVHQQGDTGGWRRTVLRRERRRRSGRREVVSERVGRKEPREEPADGFDDEHLVEQRP